MSSQRSDGTNGCRFSDRTDPDKLKSGIELAGPLVGDLTGDVTGDVTGTVNGVEFPIELAESEVTAGDIWTALEAAGVLVEPAA